MTACPGLYRGFPRSARGGGVIALGSSILRRRGVHNWYLAATNSHMPQHSRISHFENYKLTKPHQGFTGITLSNLALALSPGLAPGLLDT